ncbi:MAG: hypothetical protein IPK82_34055 [Polyangiaceae bacterium]|nr:hypothetical protein [Polyangiaceae bacterium]
MNSLYLLVEGEGTEPALYKAWLPLMRPGATRLARPEDAATQAGFYIVAGYGYPNLLGRLGSAVEDVSAFPGFERLVVALDSEDRGVEYARAEVLAEVARYKCPVPVDVVVARCCVESWLLGNRRFVKRNPATQALQAFRREYDVTELDPEAMPTSGRKGTTRVPNTTRLTFARRSLSAGSGSQKRGPAKQPSPISLKHYNFGRPLKIHRTWPRLGRWWRRSRFVTGEFPHSASLFLTSHRG